MQNFGGILGYVMIKGVDKPRILAWGTLTKKLKAQFLIEGSIPPLLYFLDRKRIIQKVEKDRIRS